MKVSIINNQPIYGIDYSQREDCTEVFEITQEDFQKIQSGTHTLDIETKELVEVPVVEEKEEETLVDTDTENEETSEES